VASRTRAQTKWKARYIKAHCEREGICPSCFEKTKPGEVAGKCLKAMFAKMRVVPKQRPLPPPPQQVASLGTAGGAGAAAAVPESPEADAPATPQLRARGRRDEEVESSGDDREE